MNRSSRFTAWAALVLLLPADVSAQKRYSRVVEQILDAWKTADVVCLGEDHGRFYDSQLRIELVRHPAFARTVHTIIVESANPIHQDLLDQFVLDGRVMSRAELAPIWRDASNPETWESPIYEQFLRAVRDVNLALPRADRIRVLGGDSRIDWTKIKTAADLAPLVNRGGNIRQEVAEQILDKNLKALAIYGGAHCVKTGGGFPGELAPKYGAARFWSIGGVPRNGAHAARAEYGLGVDPAYVLMAATRRSYDAIIYHGDVRDSVVNIDPTELTAAMGTELRRRAQLDAAAFDLWLRRPLR